MESAHTTPIKSPDYAQHASIMGQLTDRRIDAYTLSGAYGQHKRAEMIEQIRIGKYNGLNARIRKMEFGLEPFNALKEADLNRETRRNKQPAPKIDHDAMLRQLLADHGFTN